MRTILALCVVILIIGVLLAWRSLRAPDHFGEFIGAPTVDASEVIDHPKDFLGKTISVQTRVSEQCKSMGCYFFIHSGKKTLRVELQEIAMNAPMREGHVARVEGQIVPYGDGYQLFASAVEFE